MSSGGWRRSRWDPRSSRLPRPPARWPWCKPSWLPLNPPMARCFSPPRASLWGPAAWWSGPTPTSLNSTQSNPADTRVRIRRRRHGDSLLQRVSADELEGPRPARLGEEVRHHIDNVIDADVAVGEVLSRGLE